MSANHSDQLETIGRSLSWEDYANRFFSFFARDLPWVLVAFLLVQAVVLVGSLNGIPWLVYLAPEGVGFLRFSLWAALLIVFGLGECLAIMRIALAGKPADAPHMDPQAQGSSRILIFLSLPILWLFGLAKVFLAHLGGTILGAAFCFLGLGMRTLPVYPFWEILPVSGFFLLPGAVGCYFLARDVPERGISTLMLRALWFAGGIFLTAFSCYHLQWHHLHLILKTELNRPSDAKTEELLLRALSSHHPPTRIEAAQRCHSLASSSTRIRPLLRQLLQDPHREVRIAAAIALGRSQDSEALSVLITRSLPPEFAPPDGDISRFEERSLIQALQCYPPEDLLPNLRKGDPPQKLRVFQAIPRNRLHLLDEPLAREMLNLGMKSPEISRIDLLEGFKDRPHLILPFLENLLSNEDPYQFRTAMSVLRTLGSASQLFLPLLIPRIYQENRFKTREIASLVLDIGTPSLPILERARLHAPASHLPLLEIFIRDIQKRLPQAAYVPATQIMASSAERPLFPLVEFRLLCGGEPISFSASNTPEVSVYDSVVREFRKADVEPESGLVTIRGLGPGTFTVNARFNANEGNPHGFPGDMSGFGQWYLPPEQSTLKIDLHMSEYIRMKAPFDNDLPSNPHGSFSRTVHFSWDPLGEGVTYFLQILGGKPGFREFVETQTASFSIDLPPGNFQFFMYAMLNGNQRGLLLLRHQDDHPGGNSFVSSQYQFRVFPSEAASENRIFELRHAGKPLGIDPREDPWEFRLYAENGESFKKFEPVWFPDHVEIRDLPPGIHQLWVLCDLDTGNGMGERGDLAGTIDFTVPALKVEPIRLDLWKILDLTAPEETDQGCLAHRSEIGPPVLENPVEFSWTPLPEAESYRFKTASYGGFQSTVPGSATLTIRNLYVHQVHHFSLEAVNGGQVVGKLLIRDGSKLHLFYPFKVSAAPQ